MSYETAFSLISLSVMPAWALLLLAPKASITRQWAQASFLTLGLALVYGYFVVLGMAFGGAAEGAGMSSLSQVMALFTSPVSMLAGWTHYLVFDLFVGAWIVRDAGRRNVAHLWCIPCLLLTFMFGPLGLALYLIIRKISGKGGWSLAE